MTQTRTETDSFGPLEVPTDKYWGAQTQRSIMNFPIGWEKQPVAIVRALGVIKQACAMENKPRAISSCFMGFIFSDICSLVSLTCLKDPDMASKRYPHLQFDRSSGPS